MSYLVFARKYRPQTFEEVVQQDHVTRTLTNAISTGRVSHAILFSGPRGTGKTTVARILAKAMNCQDGPTRIPCNACRSCTEITAGNAVDVYEIDGASNNSVDQVRELRDNIKYMPAHCRYKIYIIDEVHMLSIAAFNALLKTLEEPPAHVMFLFATTEPHKIPVTILSRCQRHDFRRIGMSAIAGHLELICGKEDSDVDLESLNLIAQEAGGSMRDALSLLDQVVACIDGPVSHDKAVDILGVVDRNTLFAFSRAILDRNADRVLDMVEDVYGHGHDMKKLHGDLVRHFRNLLVVKLGRNVGKLVDVPAHEIEWMQEQVKGVPADFLNRLFDGIFDAEAAIKLSGQPRMALETTLLRLIQLSPSLSIETLIEKLDLLKRDFSGPELVQPRQPVETIRAPAADPMPGSPSYAKEPDRNPAGGDIPAVAAGDAMQNRDPGDAWHRLIEAVSRKHPAVGPSLAKGSLQSMTGKKMVIEVDGNGFTVKMIQKNMRVVTEICRTLFGADMEVVLDIVQKQGRDRNQKKKKESHARQEALNHPLVADTLEVFKGKIADVKIL